MQSLLFLAEGLGSRLARDPDSRALRAEARLYEPARSTFNSRLIKEGADAFV